MIQDQDEIINDIRLINSKNVGDINFIKLVQKFGSSKNAIYEIEKSPFLKQKITLLKENEAEKEIQLAEKNNINIINYKSPVYPPLLKQIHNFPPILYAKGNLKLLTKRTIAIVGSRNASLTGIQNAKIFSSKLGKYGFAVVSGLARGIDTIAHTYSLDNGTIAVVAGGVNVVYPSENQKLYDEIAQKGVIISEQRINKKPFSQLFPRRNRIIAGLAKAALIIEATINSGSIITAELALNNNKDVFAIPGNPNDPRSKGVNKLIKQGAILTESAEDIVEIIKDIKIMREEMPLENTKNYSSNINYKENKHVYSKILSLISKEPMDIDIIFRKIELDYNTINDILFEMEISGEISKDSSNKIVKNIKV